MKFAIGVALLASILLPRFALAQAPPLDELPTVLCHFDCADFSYSNNEKARTFAELTQTKLSDLPQAAWVEREQMNAALQELQLSAWNQNSAATALQLGKIVSAELAIVGRFEFEKSKDMPWTLHFEIIDLNAADVLATDSLHFAAEEIKEPPKVLPHNHPDFREGVEPLPIREDDAIKAADAIRRQYQAALKAHAHRRQQIQVAVLHFRNEAPATRLDFLESDLLKAFARLSETPADTTQTLHVLQFPRAANAIEEAQLLADGLAERVSGDARRADYFAWGNYRETSPSETPFPDVEVELKLNLWNGIGEPQSFRLKAKTRDLAVLIEDAVNIVKRQATQRAAGELETLSRQRLAQQLHRRSLEISKATFRNPSEIQTIRNQHQILRLLGMAALFDVNNAAIRGELNLQSNYHVTYPETNREAFSRKFKEYSDWRRYADKFGNAVKFDDSNLPDRSFKSYERFDAIEPVLVVTLMQATGSKLSPSLLRTPTDVPDELVAEWHQVFVNEFVQGLSEELRNENDSRPFYTSFKSLLNVIDYVDPPKLRGELIVGLMKHMPAENNWHLLSEPEGRALTESSQRIIEAFHAINQPQRVDELREAIKRGNPNWGKMAQPYQSPYQLKKLTEKEAAERGEVKPPPKPRKPFVPEARIVDLPLRPIVLPAGSIVNEKLPYDRAYAVTFAGGNLWVGISNSTRNDRVIRIVAHEGQLQINELPKRIEAFGHMLDLGDQFWVANLGVGIECFNQKMNDSGRAVLHSKNQFTPRDGLPTEFIQAMARDGENVYCSGGFNNIGVLGRYDLKTETWSRIDLPRWQWGDREVEADEIRLLAAGNGKVAVYGNVSNRVLVRDQAGGDWINATELILGKHPELAFAQKTRLEVRGLHFADGLLWIASMKGIVAFDLKQNRVAAMVPTKFEITTMCPHGEDLWIGGSGSRLLRFDCSSRAFDVRVNLSRKYPGAPTSIAVADGRLWYGLIQGKCIVMEVDISGLD